METIKKVITDFMLFHYNEDNIEIFKTLFEGEEINTVEDVIHKMIDIYECEGKPAHLESGKCNKHIVKPRFVPENLVMKGGAHIMRVDVFEDFRKQPACRIKCIDDLSCTQDLDGEWVEEIGEGCFYLDVEKIDLVISKLQEAKAFLNGA